MSTLIALEELAAVATVAGASLATAGYVGRKIRRAVKRVGTFLDDYEGTPGRPGVPARLGVMQRLEVAEADRAADRASTKRENERQLRSIERQGLTLCEHGEALSELKAGLDAVIHEMPRNGVPLAHKIDALWSKHQADQAVELAAQAVAAAAAARASSPPGPHTSPSAPGSRSGSSPTS